MMVLDSRNMIRSLLACCLAGMVTMALSGCTPMDTGGDGTPNDNGSMNDGDGNDNGNGDGTDNGNDGDAGQDVPDNSNGNDGTDNGGDTPVDNGNDNGGDDPVDNGNDNGGDDPVDNGNDNGGDDPVDNGNDNGGDDPVDNGNDNGDGTDDGDLDDDGDGVANANDDCPGTAANAAVDAVGCPVPTGGGGGGGGGGQTGQEDADDDGVRDADDLCADTPRNTQVDADGCPIDDGGDANNDSCMTPATILDDSQVDGTPTFSTVGATTDGGNEPTRCLGGTSLIENDIWYCYTATCTGLATAGLCGSNYDTMLAVYAGCGCPSEDSALFCSDDNCGSTYLTSRLTFPTQEGEQYMIRIGGFQGATGDGFLHVECGQAVGCPADATGDCTAEGGNGTPGCSDAQCCADVCTIDAYCCDVTWDDRCAEEALGVCNGAFTACQTADNACAVPDVQDGGCSDQSCCQQICEEDPICCLDMWDEFCVDAASDCAGNVCGSATGSCFQTRTTGGCGDADCCDAVCQADSVCCDIEWDSECVDLARSLPDVCSN